jgi:hypothetical protein
MPRKQLSDEVLEFLRQAGRKGGKIGGKIGGKRSLVTMTRAQREARAKKAAAVRWGLAKTRRRKAQGRKG